MARTLKQFLRDVTKKPPVMMPYVAAAHVLWLLWTVVTCMSASAGILWLQALWMAAYTVCWIAACDLRRWGAIGYVLLTVANTCIYLGVKNVYDRDLYASNLFILDALFSFYLIVFFRRITRKA